MYVYHALPTQILTQTLQSVVTKNLQGAFGALRAHQKVTDVQYFSLRHQDNFEQSESFLKEIRIIKLQGIHLQNIDAMIRIYHQRSLSTAFHRIRGCAAPPAPEPFLSHSRQYTKQIESNQIKNLVT